MVKGGALQGYLIDKKTADEHNIKSLADFKNPEIAALFSTTDDKKAALVACPPGWGCELIIDHQLDAYGLRDTVNPIKASYEASMADALGRFKAGKPVFFYAATPGWAVGVMKPGKDVVWLDVPFSSLPKGQEADESKTVVPGVQGCVTDPCNMGFPPNDIRVVANNKFLDENPAAKKLFELVKIPLDDLSAENVKMNAGENKDEDIIRHAEEWIAAHKAEYDDWIKQAKAAAQ
jgi:glycine betaine/proline transport system substrate-binding protein